MPEEVEGVVKGVVAQVEGEPAAIGGDAGGEAPLEVAGKEEPPAEGEPEGKGEAAPVEGAPGAITVDGVEEGRKGDAEAKEAAAEDEEEEGEKWLKHYSSMYSILLVGDGDFSFSLALATAFGSGASLVATSLDTYEVLRGKYSKAESNIMDLKRLGATVLHGIDAKTMMFHTDLRNIQFDRIVFNFPHAGFKGKEDDLHMINLHKELMWYFFYNAHRLLRRYGEIHVTHKTGHPYDRWDLEQLASECSLVLVAKVVFQKEDYPGYNQKRGDSARCDEPFDLATACTFKFQIGELKKLKKMNGNRAGSILNLGGSNIHPGQLATDRGPFHPVPPVEAWSLHPNLLATDRGPFHPLLPVEAWPPHPGQLATDRGPLHLHPPVEAWPPHPDQLATDRGHLDPLPPVEAWPPHPGQLTTDRGPLHLLPRVETWPPQHFPPPVNADYIPQHPYIGDERQQPGFPLNSDGIVGAPYFHEHDSFHPRLSMPGPSPNDFPAPGVIPSRMGRIPYPDLLPPPEQPWYQPRTISDPAESDDYSYFTWEYQRSLQRQYDMRRHLMPGSTSSTYYAFLEHRHMESAKKQEWLRKMIASYGRQ